MVDPVVGGDGCDFWGVDMGFCRVSKYKFKQGV